jgi:hypothetical protein
VIHHFESFLAQRSVVASMMTYFVEDCVCEQIAFRVGVFEIDRRGNDGVANGEGAGGGLASVKTGRCPRLRIDFDVHEACGVDQYSLEIGP